MAGTGIQSLTPGTTIIDVIPTQYPFVATVGRANPPNRYDVGLLRFGSQGFWQPAFPIDADNMWVPVPAGADEVGYSVFSGGIITIEETISTPSVPNWEKQPWDRNPTPIVIGSTVQISGGTPQTSAFTYTVPANRVFILSGARVQLVRVATATTTGGAYAAVQVNGANIVLTWVWNNEVGTAQEDAMQAGGVTLPAGSRVDGMYLDSETGGAFDVLLAFTGTEFDA